jgi:endonuclease/exonuclease/phosphatase family metal-dependent hydrolase
MKSLIKIVLWIILVVFLAIIGFFLFITLSDFKPPAVVDLMESKVPGTGEPLDEDTLVINTWNIGYAGLGAEMDFFYDGGKGVRPSRELVDTYLKGIIEALKSNPADFWLLQEVDVRSKRSYKTDEKEAIKRVFPGHHAVFAYNYKVPFVPVPIYEPMGKVNAGMMTLSVKSPIEAARYAYPLIASWPDRLFLLDRCFILTRYPIAGSPVQLVLLNTHNSAYVYDSVLRRKELEIIKAKMIEEYAAGNFVIAGGDWNANPPGFSPAGIFSGHRFEAAAVKMDPDLLPAGWTWVYDANAPTNRNNDAPYQKGVNGTTCLDYFVVSPNLEILDIRTIDLEFRSSDHNPVSVKVRLKK